MQLSFENQSAEWKAQASILAIQNNPSKKALKQAVNALLFLARVLDSLKESPLFSAYLRRFLDESPSNV